MTQEEMDEKYSSQICAEPGCYNKPVAGYVYCDACLYGFSHKASKEAIEWKRRKERDEYKNTKSTILGI